MNQKDIEVLEDKIEDLEREVSSLEWDKEGLEEDVDNLREALRKRDSTYELFVQHLIDHSDAWTHDVIAFIESGQFERARLLLKGG